MAGFCHAWPDVHRRTRDCCIYSFTLGFSYRHPILQRTGLGFGWVLECCFLDWRLRRASDSDVLGSVTISAASFISLASLGRFYHFMDMVLFCDGVCETLRWPNHQRIELAGAQRSADSIRC